MTMSKTSTERRTPVTTMLPDNQEINFDFLGSLNHFVDISFAFYCCTFFSDLKKKNEVFS